jgi:hypothetical protein
VAYLIVLAPMGCSSNSIELRTDKTVPYVKGKDPEPSVPAGNMGDANEKAKPPMPKWQGGTAATKPTPPK